MKAETYDAMVTRCAGYVLEGILRGDGLRSSVQFAIGQALLWRATEETARKKSKKK